MESWVPLFDIFLNSPSPEAEAAMWLQKSFDASSTTHRITTSSFLSLLTKPSDAIVVDSSSSSSSVPTSEKKIMWIETLPGAVQSRVLSFLLLEHKRFCAQDLCKLARDLLRCDQGLDFWVEKAARNLLDVLSESNYDWISCLGLDSNEDRGDDEFHSLPSWLKEASENAELVLPWLPISPDDLRLRTTFGVSGDDTDPGIGDKENEDEEMIEVEPEMGKAESAPIEPEIQKNAAALRARLLTFQSTSEIVGLADEIRNLCSSSGDASAILSLIEPWKADDETASVLISHLSDGREEQTSWPREVLCSIILPKILELENPAPRVLVSSTIEYCKIHQNASVYALLFPLFLRNQGINNPIGDVVSRIIRECLHPAHVSAFCQNLLHGQEERKKPICLPCHQNWISNELVWTESLFMVFQNILNHNVYLTQDSVDHLVHYIGLSASRLSKSLKFGNFLLCFVSKCFMSLKSHKLLLTTAVENTNTLVTKSVLSKLASL